ncbi:MAG: D-arginine dehydrogenase [Myxococcota bacterium]
MDIIAAGDTLLGMNSPDVIIVGAGLAGCSVAAHLAPHCRVLLVEQAPQPGQEAAAQNAGMVRRLGEDPFERALAIRTAERLGTLGDEWEGLQPSRVTGALLALAHDPLHLHDAVAHLRAHGVTVESIDRPAELAPILAGSRLQQAWHVPDERVADAHALVTGLLRQAKRNRAEVQCRVTVSKLRVVGGRVCGVETDQGTIDAGAVVLAAGAWSARLAAGVGLHRPLIPIRRTLLHSHPHPLSVPGHPWCWIDDVGIYARPEGEGWLISGCDEAAVVVPDGPGSAGPVEALQRAQAMDKLARYMPPLAGVRLQRGWTGLRTFAPDRRPVLGADPALEGLWWAAGLGGFGVTCSLATGEVLAAWMQGETLDWFEKHGVSPGRRFPGRWPIRPSGELHRPRLIAALPQLVRG